MHDQDHDRNRRGFLRQAAAGAIGIPVVSLLGGTRAFGADKPRVDPSSAKASALNYVHDASKASDVPGHEKGEHCAICVQWTGGNSEWGTCNIFPGKLVHRKGWCSAFVKQTG